MASYLPGATSISKQPAPHVKTYLKTAALLLNLTIASKEHVPLWGTCMGIQTLSILVAGDSSVLDTNVYDSERLMLPLELTSAAASSAMFGSCPADILSTFTKHPSTTNLHHDGVAPQTFARNARLSSFFNVLSVNQDRAKRPFVSTIEAKAGIPVYGVQWHPERPPYEFTYGNFSSDPIAHDEETIAANEWIARFFVSEARKNEHSFPSETELQKSLIYRWGMRGNNSYEWYHFD